MLYLCRLTVAFLSLTLLPAVASAAQDRVALIIGNAKYAAQPVLKNPANDALLVDKSLKGLGFETITVIDGTRQQMVKAMQRFMKRVTPETSVVVYFAGHGIQYDGENYLMPVDGEITEAADLPLEAISLQIIIEQVAREKPRIAIMILDACRDNPLRNAKNADGTSSEVMMAGLARVTGPIGTYIAYATAPGQVALDGREGNSYFTRALGDVVGVPGLPIEQVFKRVRERVAEKTKGRQIPWDNSSLVSEFFFKEALDSQPPLSVEAEKDAKAWQVASQTNSPEAYKAYLAAFPQGLFTDIVGERLSKQKVNGEAQPVEVAASQLPANRTVNSANDLQTWNAIASSQDPGDFQNYLASFPQGLFSNLARLRMEALTKGSLTEVTSLNTKLTPNFVEFETSPLYPEITQCDRLAGHVQEIADPAVGVFFKQIQPDKAIPACLEALKQYPDSMRILINYGRAIDAAGRHDEAREIYRTGVAAGFPIAYRSLGDVYRDGRGIAKDINEARYWYVLGAARHNVFAEYNLAAIYENGLGVPVDKKKAVYWLWRGARQGFAPAMNRLAGYYLAGDVVGKDVQQASVLLEGAVEMGNAAAQLQLGELLVSKRTARSIRDGRNLTEKSAMQGNAWAQASLGKLFLEGVGGKKDPAEALKWFVLSQKGGIEYVAEPISTLVKSLGQGAKNDADRFAADFVARPNG